MGGGLDFTWWNIVPTLVGGAISLVTAITMFSFAQSVERKKRQAEKKSEEATSAFVGFRKLVVVAEALGNLDRELDNAFSHAENIGLENSEPCDKVRGLVGLSNRLEPLVAKELLFLNKAKRSELINEIDLIVHRALNTEESIRRYGELRTEAQLFMEQHSEIVENPTDNVGSFQLSGKSGAIFKLKRQGLNDLLSQIQTHLKSDNESARKATDEYIVIARKYFGNDFPEFSFEWVKK